MFRRILIANRGEIALRVIRACRGLGIETVVVYSEADRDAPWLRQADRAVCIGPARAEDSYLDAGALLQAAEQTECQAIHPGYGFLAENALFAARSEQQGIAFIGPRPGTIRRMGDKVEARRTMAALGIPTIPGSADVLRDLAEALREAAAIGYPVLLKATAGGGGRGMRACASEGDLSPAFAEAAREAQAAFGDPGLYLEKLIEGGRHIEFQILGDADGRAVHLGERECSVQRHHQKLLEESPSPAMREAGREALGARAARAAASLGYRGAGTVEFLRAPDGGLFFMEMNTRIQVEHPVTEMVTGIDLVAEQIRVAAGHPLRLRQKGVRLAGHALEMRINAEDPEAGFRPDPGTITELVPPPAGRAGVAVRWDSAIEPGYRIPPHYDSLIGKLIVHGPDRPAALAGAREALATLRVGGVRTTIPLLRRILDHADFERGDYDVGFLARSGLVGAPADGPRVAGRGAPDRGPEGGAAASPGAAGPEPEAAVRRGGGNGGRGRRAARRSPR
jgi:acetyl-CoA carboxylase biotin carboxylase subunit